MADDKILHQDDVEVVIGTTVESGVGLNNPAIEDVVEDVADAGVAYAQVEVNAIVTAVNEHGTAINAILAALRANGIIDESES